MNVKALVGSGDKIALLTLPFLIVGLILNVAYPSLFDVGGPPNIRRVVSFVVLVPGVAIWLWSIILILTKVPKGELITSGPNSLVKHPLYTSVALLVLPWIGIPPEHVARSSDRGSPLHRVQGICARRGGRTVEDLRRLLG
jgi:protein-S-isoprenylcysteine O-methyltransferase Ste14